MFSFLVLSIPCVAAAYCFFSEYRMRDFLIPCVAGLISGAAVSCVREFFIFSVYVPTAFFPEHVLHLSASIFFPSVFIGAIFFFFCRDDFRYRSKVFFPLLAFFYAVYTPYSTISAGEKETFFALFLNPVLTISTVAMIQCSVEKFHDASEKKFRPVPAILIFVSACLIQPVIESIWFFKICGNLYFFLSIFYVFAVFVLYKFTFRKKISLDTIQ